MIVKHILKKYFISCLASLSFPCIGYSRLLQETIWTCWCCTVYNVYNAYYTWHILCCNAPSDSDSVAVSDRIERRFSMSFIKSIKRFNTCFFLSFKINLKLLNVDFESMEQLTPGYLGKTCCDVLTAFRRKVYPAI